ncbi:hypothetical protein GeomeDRAFT_0420 [Geobacter metallireducens RCH3]|uniref:Lipoprotein n=1 Tax=Geobacter metallireducens (strain ATCC 53774 / DSM 7210 / GS-15) TaxID=269799 RepID=Q39S96_GEOMG|nr:hypothetical protein [Geobacter metallireducens]ABB32878.1 hypothetical protein Gmet_2660 [Geobacter metallireducens GS-15]EHP88988.1 hypothetical protein GeomeDRAFT_0420 [Geobacter metallireducens RCH3]
MKASTVVTKRCNPRALLPCLVLLAALAVWDGPAQAGTSLPSSALPLTHSVPHELIPGIPDPDGFVTVEVGDYFSCDIPPEWSRVDNYGSGLGLSNEEKKTYGFHLKAPEPGEPSVAISIFYYAEGNLMYKSVDHYLRVFAQPALGVSLDGSSYGDVTAVKVAGRDGMVFERVKKEYAPRESGTGGPVKPGVYIRPGLNATRIPIRERFVVLPAKQGFFALRYTAPEEKFREFLPVFEKVTQRFFPGGRYTYESRDTERGPSHDYGHEVY